MVDTRDLKSLGSDAVRVRLPPRLPHVYMTHNKFKRHDLVLIRSEILPEGGIKG